MAAKKSWRRRILFAFLALLLAVVSVPAYVFVRLRFFQPHYDVESIRTSEHYQDEALLERAWSLPTAREFDHRVVWQTNGSTCGPSSLANTLRSLDQNATESTVLEGTGLCWSGGCLGGLTLDELARVARSASHRRITILRNLTLESLREHVRRSNDPSVRYIVNFHRGPLFSEGGGHHSPLVGYLEDLDLVFVLDVNESFRPWLVETERLFRAIDTVDDSSGQKRGLLLIR